VADRAGEILDAAWVLFAERGYHEVGIADVAGELGLGHGTVYRYFDNKRQLFGQVVDRVVERLAATLHDEPFDAATTLDEYRGQVERIGKRLADVFIQDRHLAQLLFVQHTGVDADARLQLKQARDIMAFTTQQYLANGVERGFLPQDLDLEITARMMNAMVVEAVNHVIDFDDPVAARDAWIRAATKMIFNGIAGGASAATPGKGASSRD
jgi:AcrR family transcriptional regulator